jgi:hypothetical protein
MTPPAVSSDITDIGKVHRHPGCAAGETFDQGYIARRLRRENASVN